MTSVAVCASSTPVRLSADVVSFASGIKEIDARPFVMVNMYVGTAVDVSCRRSGSLQRARETAGDLDVVPANTPCTWHTAQSGEILIMRLPTSMLRTVADDLELPAHDIELADRFQLRDPQLEHIGWALKADIDTGSASGRLFREGLGTALAARVLQRHSRHSLPARARSGALSSRTLKRVLAYIEAHLRDDVSLADIAAVAELGSSQLQVRFRRSLGVSVYRHVVQRRVTVAQQLLRNPTLSIAEVAAATGFSHASHLSRHMRRLIGATPQAFRRDIS